MTTDDILPLPMGAHAQASYRSRMQALREYGINPSAIHMTDENRQIAKAARQSRERTLQGESDAVAI